MRLRRKTSVDEARATLAQLEATQAELQSAIAAEAAKLGPLELEVSGLSDLDARALLGEISAEAAARHRVESVAALQATRDELARLESIQEAISRRIESASRDVHEAEVDVAANSYLSACKDQQRASAAFADSPSPDTLDALTSARAASASVWHRLADAVGDGALPVFKPEQVDEPPWPESSAVVAEVLKAGPMRPSAELARGVEESRRQGDRQDDEQLEWAIRQSKDPWRREQIRAQLPEHLHERYDARIAALVAAGKRRLAELEAAAEHPIERMDERVVA